MYDRLMFLWRTAAQVLVGSLVTWLAARGLQLDPATATAATTLLYGLGVVGYAFIVHWLETRKGDGMLASAARVIARVLQFGAPAKVAYRPA